MLKRLSILTFVFCLLLQTPLYALENTADGQPESEQSSTSNKEDTHNETTRPVIITEIYPNAPGSGELGSEFIELHNTTDEAIVLGGFLLQRAETDNIIELDEYEIEPQEYLAIITPFSLLNSGGKILLHHPTIKENSESESAEDEEALTLEQSYISVDEFSSWSLIGDEWQLAQPTPGQENPVPQTEEDQDAEVEADEQTQTDDENHSGDHEEPTESNNPPEVTQEEGESPCKADDIIINEIVANPEGSDKNGGEFIELYNAGDENASLFECIIATDKLDELVLDTITVEPGHYYTVELSNDLLNGGGSVSFITSDAELVVEYPELSDDESWSLIDSAWQESEIATPGAENQPTPEEKTTLSASSTRELKPCEPNEFRNPETNRCKDKVSPVSVLKPCGPGRARNPITNRCRNLTSSSSSTLKPCAPDQERNPATNRCRKIKSASNELKPCDEGEERNPETNRCRKVAQVLGSRTADPPPKQAGIHTGVFIFMTALALAYGVYEYRLDIENLYHEAKKRFSKQKSILQKQG